VVIFLFRLSVSEIQFPVPTTSDAPDSVGWTAGWLRAFPPVSDTMNF